MSAHQMHNQGLGATCKPIRLAPSLTEKLPGPDLPHVFSCSAASLPFGSFVVFVVIIRRLLLFFLSTLSFGLLFHARFGHCSGMRRLKKSSFTLSFSVYFKSV